MDYVRKKQTFKTKILIDVDGIDDYQHEYIDIEGYRCFIHGFPNRKMFVYQDQLTSKWHVVDEKSGLSISKLCKTLNEALKQAESYNILEREAIIKLLDK